MSVLCVQNLTLQQHQHCLLSDVSFELKAGEVLALIGPNGAGKTSLIRALSAELTPAAGQILFNQTPLAQWQPGLRAQQLAVLPQRSVLSFPYTVEEVVQLGRIPHSTGIKEDRHIAREAMQALDIHHLADRIYTDLSGGEKQRTQLARVLAQIWLCGGKSLLILDEPTGALDLGHKQQLMQVITGFAGAGCAVIMAEHDINLALAHAHTVLALKNGRAEALTAAEDISAEIISHLFDAPVTRLHHPQTRKPVFLP